MNDNHISMTIKDDADTVTYGLLEVPLTRELVDGKANKTDLNGDVFTYLLFSGKRKIKHKWEWMTAEEFAQLRGFERRQYSTYKRPLLTIERLGIYDMPVVMEVGDEDIINDCGLVGGVSVEFRETVQKSVGGDSAGR